MTKKNLKYKSAFDIIGPIMVGPSSSHTAGAVRIGKIARKLFNHLPTKLVVTFYGSFAETYKGHGTAVAIVAGVLDFETHDERIPFALEEAKKRNITVEFVTSTEETVHANTAKLVLTNGQLNFEMTAISIGGGNIQVTEINHHLIKDLSLETSLLIRLKNVEAAMSILKVWLNEPSFTKIAEIEQEEIFHVHTKEPISNKLLEKIATLTEVTSVVTTDG